MKIWIILVLINITGFASDNWRNTGAAFYNEVGFHELLIINETADCYGGYSEKRIIRFENNDGKVKDKFYNLGTW